MERPEARKGAMVRYERRLERGWTFRLLDGAGHPRGEPREVTVPSPWQRYPGAWRHRGRAEYTLELPPPVEEGARRWLRFEGVHYRCEIRAGGRRIARHEGGWDPFWVPLPEVLPEGRLSVLVESHGPGLPVEEIPSGFLPDCGILPAGIWKPVYLVESGGVVVEGARVAWRPGRRILRVAPRTAAVRGNRTRKIEAVLHDPGNREVARAASRHAARRALELPVPDPEPWHPGRPRCYTLQVRVEDDAGREDRWTAPVGLRHLAVRKGRLFLNGEAVFLRGILHWGYDPVLLAGPREPGTIRQELEKVRALGFNMVKHCLYVPFEAYFEAADRMGILQWLEMPMWLPSGSPAFRERALREFPRIAAAFQHHPSLLFLSLGCEVGAAVDAPFLERLHRSVKRRVPGALLCDNSGSGTCYGGPEEDASEFEDYHFYAEPVHLPALLDAFGADRPGDRPWIFGEFCDSDGYRDPAALRRDLPPEARWWLSPDAARNPLAGGSRVQEELGVLFQEERLAALGFQGDPTRLRAAAALHTACHRKATLECIRRYGRVGGYVITGLRDTPIATSGVLDDRGRPRVDPEAFRVLNSPDLLLLIPPGRRAWIHGGDRAAGFDLHHQEGGTCLRVPVGAALSRTGSARAAPPVVFRLRGPGGEHLAEGAIPVTVPLSPGVNRLGTLACPLPEVSETRACSLELFWPRVPAPLANAWPLWIHPPEVLRAAEAFHLHDPLGELGRMERFRGGEEAPVWITPVFDAAVERRLEEGGGVILLQGAPAPLPTVRLPLWREGVMLPEDHVLARAFPFRDGGGEELLALTTDRFFTGAVPEPWASRGIRLRPVLSRLDLRRFHRTLALAELEGFPGRCAATTLRVFGGEGALPRGEGGNRGGRALLAGLGAWVSGG